eukprot:2601321-Rhodomonas_salina.2
MLVILMLSSLRARLWLSHHLLFLLLLLLGQCAHAPSLEQGGCGRGGRVGAGGEVVGEHHRRVLRHLQRPEPVLLRAQKRLQRRRRLHRLALRLHFRHALVFHRRPCRVLVRVLD